jgi:prophage DNA circulation protein
MKNYIMFFCFSLIVAGISYYVGRQHIQCGSTAHISSKHCDLKTNMRKLWSDHVWWTRDYLITAIADMPDVQAATTRLLKNQEDIGTAIVPYYGKEAGEKLTALLKEHILISADVVAAAKENNNVKLKEEDEKLHANADDIALFLSTANQNWTQDTIKDMMYEHLKLTTEEAVARLKKDWSTDIESFEKVFDEIMEMSDALTMGIIKQFPEKF